MSDSPAEAPALAPGVRLVVDLEAMVHGGLCLAHTEDGITLLIDGGIPGERAEIELSYRKRKLWFARVVEAQTPSEHRVVPRCKYVGTCGGCQMQHVSADHQLTLKREIVLDAMRRQHVPLPADVTVHGMDDPWRYRWRGEFHVVPGDNGMKDSALGFNKVRSWHPVAIDDCLIHHPTIAGALPALRDLVQRGGSKELTVLHLTVGEDGAELLIRPRPVAALDAAVIDEVAAAGDHHWAREATTLRWRDHMFRATPDSFIQVNWQHLDVLYDIVLKRLGDVTGQRVLDAYAGIGVMSCVIADSAAEVICIDNNPASCRMGVHNARLNGVEGKLRYIQAGVEDAIAGACGEGVDAVILDPPRAGCESTVTGFLALGGPPRIIYVSCDPATLARDLRVLVGSGPYEVEHFDIVDMFPQTHHVECVASLRRT